MMRWTVTICVAIWLAAIPAQASDVAIHAAPELPPWPQGLPRPLRMPEDGRCVDGEGIELGPGIWLAQRRAQAVMERLERCDRLPARCQARLDALLGLHAVDLAGARDTAAADMLAARGDLEASDGWPTWMVAVLVGASASAGVIAGLAAGAL